MAPDNDSQQIIRAYVSDSAPTGESEYYETADGRIWQQCQTAWHQGTGQQYGTIRGDRIQSKTGG